MNWSAAHGLLPSLASVDHRVVASIAWDAAALLFFLVFPVRTRMALGQLETHPRMAVAAGLVGWIALLPLIALSAITIILIPLIPIELVAFSLAMFIGKAALALFVGRRLYEMLSAQTAPSTLAALILGFALLTAAELVPIVGIFVMIAVALVGLGSVLLSFLAPSSPLYPFGGPPNRPTIGGPPMRVR